MLPFETVRSGPAGGGSPPPGGPGGRTSPLKSPTTAVGFAEDSGGGGSPSKTSQGLRTDHGGMPGVFRPHSRPVGIAAHDLRYHTRSGVATPHSHNSKGGGGHQPGKGRTDLKPRSIMLPGQGNTVGVVHVAQHTKSGGTSRNTQSPSPTRRNGGGSSSSSPVRGPGGRFDPNSSNSRTETNSRGGALVVAATGGASSTLNPVIPNALGGGVGSSVHNPLGLDLVSMEDSCDGLSLEELADPMTTGIDFKRFDLDRNLPKNDHRTQIPPSMRCNLEPSIVLCPSGHTYNSHHAMDGRSFASHVVTVDEVGIERALEFLVFPETPSLFLQQPHIDALTGTLTFVTLPEVSGQCVCWMRLADNAMIHTGATVFKEEAEGGGGPAIGEPFTSPLVPFVIAVGVEEAAANASLLASRKTAASGRPRDWHSHAARMKAETVCLVQEQRSVASAAAASNGSGALASDTAASGSSVTGGGGGSGGCSYQFPPTSPHTLRFSGISFELYNKYCKNIATMKPGVLSAMGPEAQVDPLNPAYALLCQMTSPIIDSCISPLELMRLVPLCRMRDNLFGEIVPSDQLQALETKLLDRVRKEERRLGANHLDLAPLLVRLGQVYAQFGMRRQGDAIEVLERVARVRMHYIGLQQHGAMELGGIDPETIGEEALSRYEQYYQSLMMVSHFFRYIGQYPEAIEFAQFAAQVAECIAGSQTSSFYLRAICQIGEVLLISNDLHEARKVLERHLDLAEIAFGHEGPQTNVACHLLGMCYTLLNDHDKANKLHQRALYSRQMAAQQNVTVHASSLHHHGEDGAGDHHNNINILIAESLTYVVSSLVCRPTGEPLTEEALPEAERALEIFESVGVYSCLEATVAHCALLSLVATAYGSIGDVNALQLAERAAADMSGVRGEGSLEATLMQVEVAACKMRLGLLHSAEVILGGDSRSTVTPGSSSSSIAANNLTTSITATASSVSVEQQQNLPASRSTSVLDLLTTQLGPQHPITCRTWLMLAQCLLYKNRSQSLIYAEHSRTNLTKRLIRNHRDVGVACEILARVHLEMGEGHLAADCVADAYSIALQMGGVRTASLESLLCSVHSVTRQPLPPAVVNAVEQRVRIVKAKSGPTSTALIAPLQNLAEAYYLKKEFADSHHHFTRALKLADSLNMVFLLGHLFKPTAQLSPAEVEERNRMSQDRLNPCTAAHFARILLGIGAAFEAEGSLGDSQQTYLQAQASLEIAGSSTSMATVEVLMSVARVLFRDGHFGDCIAYLEKSHNLLLEFHPTERRLIRQTEEALRVVHHRLLKNGYRLHRHTDNRHKFAAYI